MYSPHPLYFHLSLTCLVPLAFHVSFSNGTTRLVDRLRFQKRGSACPRLVFTSSSLVSLASPACINQSRQPFRFSHWKNLSAVDHSSPQKYGLHYPTADLCTTACFHLSFVLLLRYRVLSIRESIWLDRPRMKLTKVSCTRFVHLSVLTNQWLS